MNDVWWDSMTSLGTPNAGRCWWGWGWVRELKREPMLAAGAPIRPPSVEEAAGNLRAPRIPLESLPLNLKAVCTDHPFERLLHSRGRDFVDIVECIQGSLSDPTDLVAFPKSEDDIANILRFCSQHNAAAIPFGGGSSVVFGVNPPQESDNYCGTVTIDMFYFDQVLEIDEESMSVRVQAGMYGPSLEKQLKKRGLTLRYFPQSFEFSTVGGWIATRGGGHFAMGPTHIDDLVESVRLVTPAGEVTESRRLPASGAGPAEYRFYLGSEGILGVVTEAWLRVRRVPTVRASATVYFRGATSDAAFMKGARAVQSISQSGLQPANLRLVDGLEVSRMTQESGLDNSAVLLIGFEASSQKPDLSNFMASALDICSDAGGEVPPSTVAGFVQEGGSRERQSLAGKWGASFMRGGYTFSGAALSGVVLNTFETAVTWDRFFAGFHDAVLSATRQAIAEQCGSGVVTCRFTHIYPDGPAPYYTVLAAGNFQPQDIRVEQWNKIKAAAMMAVMQNGGTSTHHHAVGKLHRAHFHSELGTMHRRSLEALKTLHDPAWVLNPGVLLEVRRARL